MSSVLFVIYMYAVQKEGNKITKKRRNVVDKILVRLTRAVTLHIL